MVRLTSFRSSGNARAASGNNAVVALVLALAALLATPVNAVTKAQLDTSAAQVQSLNKSIAAAESRVATLDRDLRALDRQIQDKRKLVRDERNAGRKQVFDARRDLKKQTFAIESLEKDIGLVDFDIDVVRRDIERDKLRYAELNVLKQSMEEGEFKKRQAEYQRQLDQLAEKKRPMAQNLEQAKSELAAMQSELDAVDGGNDDSSLDKDPRIAGLVQKRDRTNAEIGALNNQIRNDRNRLAQQQGSYQKLAAQFKREQASAQQSRVTSAVPAAQTIVTPPPVASAPAATAARPVLDRTDYTSYVFVISGDQEPDIEQTLHLKNWVESYGAKYIEARWNGFNSNGGPQSTAGFQEAFRGYIRQIPKEAKLVLIGHGLGGGAAIEAATRVAFSEARTIDFLAVLDPIGEQNLRANIVYDTSGSCTRPDPKDEMTNSDYVECIKSAKKRLITANIKHFYNRWQKDANGPLDFQRQIPSLDMNGKVVSVPTATGRFEIADSIDSDQKRLYFAGDKNAHKLLLAEEAKQLPKLLVQHLR